MIDCLFCSIAKNDAPVDDSPENVILQESRNFYVKPALGHFVEGYCLVISKNHLLTMAELEPPEAAELEHLLETVSSRLQTLYRRGVCTFEHGAVCPVYRAGSCIDHAHMHVIPTSADVSDRLGSYERHPILHIGDLRDFETRSESYIYYEPRPCKRFVYTCEERVPSQLMRRFICEQLGIPNKWDWRLDPFRADIQRFLKRWRIASTARSCLVAAGDAGTAIR